MKPHIKDKIKELKPNTSNVQLHNGRIKEIPHKLKICKDLKYLDLFGNSINIIPDWFFEFKNLENLSLKSNSFKELPIIIFTIENLNSLNLSDNQISKIADHYFSSLMRIEKVDLSYNHISFISNDRISYSKCRNLNLKGNKLENFPIGISDCHNLEKLDLSENNISEIDDDIFGNLENLVELNLSYNNLTYLPTSIGKLKKLKRLILSGNKINHLPIEFENLVSLEYLDFDNNPIGNVPVEISAQGASGIINYYLSLGDNEQLFEAKLLIVGQGNVGKTFLMNRLVNNDSRNLFNRRN